MPLAVYMLRSMSRARSRIEASTLLIRRAGARSSFEPSLWISSGGRSTGTFGTSTELPPCSADRAIWAKLRAKSSPETMVAF